MTVRLLVVDDEPDMEALCRQKFRAPIRKDELEISFVSNGLEALAALERSPETDVVLTDLNMPEMDGLGLLARIQDLELPLRTVVISGALDRRTDRRSANSFRCQQNSLKRNYFAKTTVEDELDTILAVGPTVVEAQDRLWLLGEVGDPAARNTRRASSPGGPTSRTRGDL